MDRALARAHSALRSASIDRHVEASLVPCCLLPEVMMETAESESDSSLA